MKKAEPTLEDGTFPPMKWDVASWRGRAVFPAWAGFMSRGGSYGAQDSSKPSTGSARLTVNPRGDDPSWKLSEAQRAAFRFQVEQGEKSVAAILTMLMPLYEKWRPEYIDEFGDELMDELMPPVNAPEEFRSLMGLCEVFIHPAEKDGIAYSGLEFGCTWEEEHGLGVLLHKDRVIFLGGADEAYNLIDDFKEE